MKGMEYFLAKSEPATYGLADFERDKQTVWDGVRNPQALQAIRAMKPGDRVFLYHSGGESSIVGLLETVSVPRPDPKEPKLTVIDLKFLHSLDPPVTLREIKESGLFEDFALVRQGRLSTMAVPANFVAWMKKRYKTL